MTDLKLDNEFGSALSGAGSKPAFANLVRFRPKDVTLKEFPTTLTLTRVQLELAAAVEQSSQLAAGTPGVKCLFRIANEIFSTERFVPSEGCWEGTGNIRFMLASNVGMLVKFIVADDQEKTLGYARLRLGRVGEGEFNVDGEVKETEQVAPQDAILGHVAVTFKVSPNFTIILSKLDSQYDTANIPSLINVISTDSKTLGHRMGAFQGALQILQSIVAELQSQEAIGSVAAKQLSAILNQASSAQGIELFEDLLWDLASLSFATEVFQPSLTFFPENVSSAARPSTGLEAAAASEGYGERSAGDWGVLSELARHPRSFALVRDDSEPVILVAGTDADVCRWTVALHLACKANAEVGEEKAAKLVIPEYCKDPLHPDRPTVGWLRRRKKVKRVLTDSFVTRFFRLTCDESAMRYTFSYGKKAQDDAELMTKLNIDQGTRVLLSNTTPVPTPFALQIMVQKVSDFSFNDNEELQVVAQLGSQLQCTRAFDPRLTTTINSTLLLPVEQASLPYANASVMTSNIGWFGEEVDLMSNQSGDDKKAQFVSFFIGQGVDVNARTALGTCSIPFSQIRFGRQEDMTLTLEGEGANGAQLFVGVTMRRLGQYKTAWPAVKTTVLQAKEVPGVDSNSEVEKQHLWEGPCLVRTAPHGLELFSPTVNPDEPNKPVMTIDYYSVEAVTDVNESTLDVAVIIEKDSIQSDQTRRANGTLVSPGCPANPINSSPNPRQASLGLSPIKASGGSTFCPASPSAAFAFDSPPPPERPSMSRRGTFGMVNRKGKSLSPKPPGKTIPWAERSPAMVTIPHDYFILRISPCPAETLKDLMGERQWMFQCRNMLLYITDKLHTQKMDNIQPSSRLFSVNPSVREKLATASSETYKIIRTDMGEIIKTSDWRKARGIGFTEKHIRMFFRLQRLSVYFAKLLESKAHPLWGFDDPIDPRAFAREEQAHLLAGRQPTHPPLIQDLDKIFASQYVQSGTFGAEAQGIENSVKGVGWALKALHRRLDEVKLFYHNSAEDIAETSRIFFQEYFLRCTGELGAHIMSDEVLREVPIEVVVAFVCFLVKRDNAFHDLLVDNSLEPDTNVFMTSILSIDSMIRRLTRRTELEIVAQWPKEGDIADGEATAYITSLLGDCSPDMENERKLSSRAPEELMRLLEKYVQLIASQCRARGNLGAKIFEGMFAAMPSYATNAAATIFALNHVLCKDISARYLAAILNDMSRSIGLVQELLEGNESFLEGIPIDVALVQGEVFSAGVEVACLLVDIALKQMDDVCAEFFQADWYADDDNALMRKACKLLVIGVDALKRDVVTAPFFDHVVGAAVEKVSFRYLAGLVLRCTDQSGGKMISEEELERMQTDVDTMQQYLSKYGDAVMTSVYHLREALVFLNEKPAILQQAVYVDILKRHHGKEEYVMKMLKILTAVRKDLRNFYVPAWLNKLAHKQNAVVQERLMIGMEGDGRASRITFDVFEWVFTADVTEPNNAYIYKYLMRCLKNSSQRWAS